MLPGTPMVWLLGAGVVSIGLFFGAVTIKHNAEVKFARKEGVAIGESTAAKDALAAAAKAAQAEREAEEKIRLETERKALIALCNRSASCEERGKYK